ncbi:MAG: phage terminase large subunit [Caldilineaceae bacterium]|nr:phage terminase large subunit [Caldilineaceae bacterium]
MTTLAKITPFARNARKLNCPPDQIHNFLRARYIPQPKQLLFHVAARACDLPGGPTQIGFGGARGPGKSHAAFAQLALDDCQRLPGLKCLYLRLQSKQAREQFDDLRRKVLRDIPHHYNASTGMLTFPNCSRIQVGHIRSEKDIDLFLGLEYDVIVIEETTTLTESKYRALRDANRTSKNFRPRIYSTANPGGIGHTWYKKRFVVPHRQQAETDTRFIPATIDDNAMIDPDYRRKLEENIGWKLRAHRHGDWDISAGQYFSNFRYQYHVIQPFQTHPEWVHWLGVDHGYNHPTVFLLLAKDDDGNVYVLDEYLRAGAFPQDHAAAVKTMLERNNVDETPLCDPRAGPDVFSRHTDRTIADRYADEGLYLKAAVTDRIQGANEIRTRLGDPERGLLPSLFITTNCTRLIECLTELLHDPANPEDVLKTNVNQYGEGGDDTYDALRYGIMSIPSKYVGGMSKGGVWEREDYGWGASKSHRSGGGFILR